MTLAATQELWGEPSASPRESARLGTVDTSGPVDVAELAVTIDSVLEPRLRPPP